MLPSAEHVTDDQAVSGAEVWIHVLPESADVYIGPKKEAATNLLPSAEEATELQLVAGALVFSQVTPEFAEVNIAV